jgi:hypothetical protein
LALNFWFVFIDKDIVGFELSLRVDPVAEVEVDVLKHCIFLLEELVKDSLEFESDALVLPVADLRDYRLLVHFLGRNCELIYVLVINGHTVSE